MSFFIPIVAFFLNRAYTYFIFVFYPKKYQDLEAVIPRYMCIILLTLPVLKLVYDNQMKGLIPGLLALMLHHILMVLNPLWNCYYLRGNINYVLIPCRIFADATFSYACRANKLYWIAASFFVDFCVETETFAIFILDPITYI